MSTKRIAILVYYYPVAYSPSILNTALYWARKGYEVDLLLDRFIYEEVEQSHPNIKIVYCTNLPPLKKITGSETASATIKSTSAIPFLSKVQAYLYLYKSIVPGWISQVKKYTTSIRDYCKYKKYSFLVAFEPEALIAAHWSGLTKIIPFYYHSLELYDANTFKNKLRKKFERKAINGAQFVVVQDEARAAVLQKELGLDFKLQLCPVSIMGPAIVNKSDYLQKKFNIPSDKKIILYTGSFYAEACFEEMALSTTSNLWKDEWVLVLHGFGGDHKKISDLKEKTKKEKLIFSQDNLSQDELDQLTSSAHIGLALYKQTNANFINTVLSSGKIAQYAKCSLPVIIISSKVSDEFMSKFGCGVTIESAKEIAKGVEKIVGDYDQYKNQMQETFHLKYDFENNYKALADLLS